KTFQATFFLNDPVLKCKAAFEIPTSNDFKNAKAELEKKFTAAFSLRQSLGNKLVQFTVVAIKCTVAVTVVPVPSKGFKGAAAAVAAPSGMKIDSNIIVNGALPIQ
ncbi:unnamed protein product, partial [Meganyctiphanes norvegica]